MRRCFFRRKKIRSVGLGYSSLQLKAITKDEENLVTFHRNNDGKGQIHNDDGPAVLYNNEVEWWYKADRYTFEDWCILTNKTDEEIVQLKLQYGS